jgi:hypothetical protein
MALISGVVHKGTPLKSMLDELCGCDTTGLDDLTLLALYRQRKAHGGDASAPSTMPPAHARVEPAPTLPRKPNTEVTPPPRRAGETRGNFYPTRMVCPICRGAGWNILCDVPEIDVWERCVTCDGHGHVQR